MYETIRIVRDTTPKVVVWENVKNVLSKKHKHNFDAYIEALNEIGYNSYYKVLNAKDYGVPQNRERIFVVSIRKDIDNGKFEFPKPVELKLRLKDMLEDNVDESYYLSKDKISKIARWKAYQKPFKRVLGNNSVSPTLTARGAGEEHSGMVTFCDELDETTDLQEYCLNIKEPKDIDTAKCVQVGDLQKYKYESDNRVHSPIGVPPCLRAKQQNSQIDVSDEHTLKIRKLTPRECWRLMGFDDTDFDKVKDVMPKNQLYKQAGNSIVVNVLEGIYTKLFKTGIFE